MDTSLVTLALDFLALSLVAFGGMVGVLPEIQRRVIDVHGWMDPRTFADLYGLGYAIPGPNVVVATLVGFHVAGVAGAVVATVCMMVPSILLAWGVSDVWHRFRDQRWRKVVQLSLLPVTVGLTLAASYLIINAAAHDWRGYVLVAGTVAVVMLTRVHPLWTIAIGAVLGWIGLV